MSNSYTPVYGFRYPNGDDSLSKLAQRIQELAEDIEASYITLGINLSGSAVLMQEGDSAGGDLTGTYPNPTIKASVGLTGSPTATTASTSDDSTRIATTAYVKDIFAEATGQQFSVIGDHIADSTNVHGITDTANLVYTNDSRLSDERVPTNASVTNAKVSNTAAIAYSKLNLAGSIVNADISNSAAIAYSKLNLTGAILEADLAFSIATQGELDAHTGASTSVHGINNTANLVYTNDSRLSDSRTPTGSAGGVLSGTYPNPGFAVDMATQSELDDHASDTTSVHGISNTADLALATGETYTGTHDYTGATINVATATAGDNDNSAASTAFVTTAVSNHEADTTSVHGISNTANLVATTDTGTVTSTMIANDTIVNADINSSAAISYSKLALSNSIVNADVATSAAIAYSKLSLSNSIVNADIATGAAIAYSKLNLSGSIVNADISASAAIADTKLDTIATAGKVSNSATTATSSNTASTIVARDASGNFSAGTITASLTGTASSANDLTGGSAGSIPYQTASGDTAMLGIGSASQVLTVSGSNLPSWAPAGTPGAHATTHTAVGADPLTLSASQITGTAVTQADTGTVTSTMILDGTIALGDLATALQEMLIPTGTVQVYSGTSAPSGWLVCAGQEVSRTTYAALDAIIGTTYGAYTNGSGGAGTTHMRLPDLRGRAIFGKDDMGGTAANRVTNAVSGITGTTLGASGGSEALHQHTHIQDSHTHTQNSHTHTQDSHNHTQNAHTHTQNAHTHTQDGHAHTLYYNTRFIPGNAGLGTFNPFGVGEAAGSNTTTTTATNQNTTATNQNTTATNIAATATNQSTTATNQSTTATNQNTGTGSSQNMPPAMMMNYIIKT